MCGTHAQWRDPIGRLHKRIYDETQTSLEEIKARSKPGLAASQMEWEDIRALLAGVPTPLQSADYSARPETPK